MFENAIQSFLGLRYESDRKGEKYIVQSHICDKKLELEGKNWWNRRNELPDLQREKKTFGRNTAVRIQWFWEYRIIFNLPPASALIAGKSTDRS